MSSQRLQKILAQAGISSRRKAEEMIQLGMVTVNGQIAKLGDKAVWGQDAIKLNGKLITSKEDPVYLAFYKPKAVISAMEDPEGRPAMAPYFNKIQKRVFTIGRLDFNSEGLLLLTNDGVMAEKIQKSEKIARVYLVKVKGHPDAEMMSRLERGGKVGERYFRPTSVRNYEEYSQKSLVQIVAVGSAAIDVRGYVESKGFLVEKITRQAIGHITLHGLEPGHYRFLQKSQLEALVVQPELGMRRVDQEGEKIDKRAERRASVEERLAAEGETARRVGRDARRRSGGAWAGNKAADDQDKPKPAAWNSDEARSRRDSWKSGAGKPLNRAQGSRAWAKSQEDGGTDEVKYDASSRAEESEAPLHTAPRDWTPSARRKGSVGRGERAQVVRDEDDGIDVAPRGRRGEAAKQRAFGGKGAAHIDRPKLGGGAHPRSYEDLYGEPGAAKPPARRPRETSEYTDQDRPSRAPHKEKGFKIHFGGAGKGGSARGRPARGGKPGGSRDGGGEQRSAFGRGRPAGGGRSFGGDRPSTGGRPSTGRPSSGGRSFGGERPSTGGRPSTGAAKPRGARFGAGRPSRSSGGASRPSAGGGARGRKPSGGGKRPRR